MDVNTFKGSPSQIGRAYGETFRDKINANLKILVRREGYTPLPKNDPHFIAWISEQEEMIKKHWPWLIEEMNGVAEGVGTSYEEILLLNLRSWQYEYYNGQPSQECSSIAVQLEDGTIGHAGALDDGIQYYCGMVKIVPDEGHAFFSFPITGTSWGSRGINSAGLTWGCASQLMPGLKRLPGSMSHDLSKRIILQTCSTVENVREFCKEFLFNINFIATDSCGELLAAHHTSTGLYEIASEPPCAVTNHIMDERILYRLYQYGYRERPPSLTSRLRLGKLRQYAQDNHGKVNGEDIRTMISDRMNGEPCTDCPKGNIVNTYANSQNCLGKLWVAEAQVNGKEEWTEYEL